MNKFALSVVFCFFLFFLLRGCAMIGAIMLVRSANCNVDIDHKQISGSCDLINGVLFEKLTVVTSDTTGLPYEYIVTQRFACYNPGMDGGQTFWPDKLYFDKVNGHYRWEADTLNIHFKRSGYSREIISAKNKPENYHPEFILSSPDYETCPVEFQSSTWYYVEIYDPRIRVIYLFVDEKNKFHIYQFSSGLSPI